MPWKMFEDTTPPRPGSAAIFVRFRGTKYTLHFMIRMVVQDSEEASVDAIMIISYLARYKLNPAMGQ